MKNSIGRQKTRDTTKEEKNVCVCVFFFFTPPPLWGRVIQRVCQKSLPNKSMNLFYSGGKKSVNKTIVNLLFRFLYFNFIDF